MAPHRPRAVCGLLAALSVSCVPASSDCSPSWWGPSEGQAAVERAIASFEAATGGQVCLREVHLYADGVPSEVAPLAPNGVVDGRMQVPEYRMSVNLDVSEQRLREVVHHELCHWKDRVEGVREGTPPGWFPGDHIDEDSILYPTPAKRSAEHFADTCMFGVGPTVEIAAQILACSPGQAFVELASGASIQAEALAWLGTEVFVRQSVVEDGLVVHPEWTGQAPYAVADVQALGAAFVALPMWGAVPEELARWDAEGRALPPLVVPPEARAQPALAVREGAEPYIEGVFDGAWRIEGDTWIAVEPLGPGVWDPWGERWVPFDGEVLVATPMGVAALDYGTLLLPDGREVLLPVGTGRPLFDSEDGAVLLTWSTPEGQLFIPLGIDLSTATIRLEPSCLGSMSARRLTRSGGRVHMVTIDADDASTFHVATLEAGP